MDLDAVLSEVERWPVVDRIRLVQEVWDRIEVQGQGPELTDELKAELDRRVEEMDRNSDAGVAWELVKARVLARLRQ